MMVLVPTLSVEPTNTGERIPCNRVASYNPPKAPMPSNTSGP